MKKHSDKHWKGAAVLLSVMLAVAALAWPAAEGVNRVYADEERGGWDESHTHYYYDFAEGTFATGFEWIWDDSKEDFCRYYFDENDGTLQTGWIETEIQWEADSGEIHTDNKWYYADPEGVIQIGWRKIDGTWYYFANDDGFMYADGVEEVSGKQYYFAEDGKLLSGWIEEPFEESGSSGVNWYYADPANDGIIATGWKKIGEYWYYFTPANEDGYGGGQLHQAGVEEINGKLYYLDRNNGRMRTSWIKEVYGDPDECDWYYADASGVLQQGWRRIGGKWYYFKRTDEYGPGGRMYKSDVYRISGKLYGFDKDGAMQYGWMRLDRPVYAGPGQKGYYSFWAYANAEGVVQTGWKKISGSWYYFDDEGAMRTNMWVKDSAGWCYLGSNGKMLTNGWARDSVGWVWLNASGRITKSSWIKYNGDWYYLKANGYMATGTQTIGGKTYRFDSQGRWIK